VEGTVVAAPGEGEDDGGHVLRAQACFQGDAVLGGRGGGGGGGGGRGGGGWGVGGVGDNK
jgi:hypothetical protein